MANIPDKLTPLSNTEACAAFHDTLSSAIGADPTPCTLACAVAQSALETGWWKHVHCYNLGKLKARASYVGDVTYFGCNERIEGSVKWFHPLSPWAGRDAWIEEHPTSVASDNQCRWRAFRTAAEGAAAQVAYWQRHARSWGALLRGDPRYFAHALYQDHYFTEFVANYYENGKLKMGYGSKLQGVYSRCYQDCVDELARIRQEPITRRSVPELLDTEDEFERMHWRRLQRIPVAIPWDECFAERARNISET